MAWTYEDLTEYAKAQKQGQPQAMALVMLKKAVSVLVSRMGPPDGRLEQGEPQVYMNAAAGESGWTLRIYDLLDRFDRPSVTAKPNTIVRVDCVATSAPESVLELRFRGTSAEQPPPRTTMRIPSVDAAFSEEEQIRIVTSFCIEARRAYDLMAAT